MNRQKYAFTLVELLLVVFLIGMAAAAAVPRFTRTVGCLEVDKTAEDIAQMIRFGQMNAMTRSRLLRMRIDAGAYWLEQVSGDGENADESSVCAVLSDHRGRRRNIPAQVSLRSSVPTVFLSPDGRISPVVITIHGDRYARSVCTGMRRGRVEIGDAE